MNFIRENVSFDSFDRNIIQAENIRSYNTQSYTIEPEYEISPSSIETSQALYNMASLTDNINRGIEALNGVKNGIEYHDVEVPYGTPVEEYEELIKSIVGYGIKDYPSTEFIGTASTDLVEGQPIQGMSESLWDKKYDSIITSEILSNGNVVAWRYDKRYLAVAHNVYPYITIYRIDNNGFIKIKDPSIPMINSIFNIEWSLDGNYLAVCYNVSPLIAIYKFENEDLIKLEDPDIFPTGTVNAVAWSPNGEYIIAGHNNNPFITLYKFDKVNLTLIKMDDSEILPSNNVNKVAWSNDGRTVLVLAGTTSTSLTIYGFIDGKLIKQSIPNGVYANWSLDGKYIVFINDSHPYISIYEIEGILFTEIPDVIVFDTNPEINENIGAIWSPNSKYLAISYNSSPYLKLYNFDGTTLNEIYVSFNLYSIKSMAWSPNNDYIAVAYNEIPYLNVYKFDGFDLIKVENPDILPLSSIASMGWYDNNTLLIGINGNPPILSYKIDNMKLVMNFSSNMSIISDSYSTAWSPDGNYLAIGHSIKPYLTVYNNFETEQSITIEPDIYTNGTIYSIAWSFNSKYIAVAHETSPFMSVYRMDTNKLTKIDNPSVLPTGIGKGVAWSTDGKYISLAHDNYPFLTIYSFDNETLIYIDDLSFKTGNFQTMSPDGKCFLINKDNMLIPFKIEESIVTALTGVYYGPYADEYLRRLSWSSNSQFIAFEFGAYINNGIPSGPTIIFEFDGQKLVRCTGIDETFYGINWFPNTNSFYTIKTSYFGDYPSSIYRCTAIGNNNFSSLIQYSTPRFCNGARISKNQNFTIIVYEPSIDYYTKSHMIIYDNRLQNVKLFDADTPIIKSSVWSNNSKYFINIIGSSPYFEVYAISSDEKNAYKVANPSIIPPYEIANAYWLPNNDGLILITDNYDGDNYLYLYTYDGGTASGSLIRTISLNVGKATYGIWSNNYQYLALPSYSTGLIIYKIDNMIISEVFRLSDLATEWIAGGDKPTFAWSPNDNYFLYLSKIGSNYKVSLYEFNGTTFILLSDNISGLISTNTTYGVHWSSNNLFIIDTTGNFTVGIYSFDGANISKLKTNPDIFIPNNATGVSWSSNNKYLAVSHHDSPYFTIYSFDGIRFTKLNNPLILPTVVGRDISWSPNNQYLAMTHNDSPYFSVYSFNGTIFTKLNNPSTFPAGIGQGIAWSSDSKYFIITHFESPYFSAYVLTRNNLVKMSNPSVQLPARGLSAEWSPDGTLLAVAHDSYPRITVYKRNGTTFTKIDPDILPTENLQYVSWSPDGKYLIVSAMYGRPFFIIYEWNGTVLTKKYDTELTQIGYLDPIKWGPNNIMDQGTYTLYTTEWIFTWNGTNINVIDSIRPSTNVEWNPVFKQLLVMTATSLLSLFHSYDLTKPISVPSSISVEGVIKNIKWSPNGLLLAVIHDTYPYITICKIDKETPSIFTKVNISDTLLPPNGDATNIAWSPDGTLLVLSTGIVYRWDGTTLKKTSTSINSGIDIAWSPDGNLLVRVGYPEFISVFERVLAPEKLDNPIHFPSGTGRCSSWKPGNKMAIIAHDNAPYITPYNFENEEFTLFNKDLTGLGIGYHTIRNISISPNGKRIAIKHANGTLTRIYKFDNIMTSLYDVSSTYSTTYDKMFWTYDGQCLILSNANSDPLMYKINESEFTLITFKKTTGTSIYGNIMISSDNKMFSIKEITKNVMTYCGLNIMDSNAGVYIDGISTNTFGAVLNDIVFTSDGEYIAIGSNTTSTAVRCYGFSNIPYLLTHSVDIQPGTIINKVLWSPDLTFFVASGNISPYIYIYRFDRKNSRLIKSNNPSILPSSAISSLSWSSDNYLAIIGLSQKLLIYKAVDNEGQSGRIRNMTSSTMNNWILHKTKSGNGLNFAFSTRDRVLRYQFDGESFQNLGTISVPVSNYGEVVSISIANNGNIAILYKEQYGGASVPYYVLYLGSGDPLIRETGERRFTSFSPDGKFVFVHGGGNGTTSDHRFFVMDGSNAVISGVPNFIKDLIWSPDSQYVAWRTSTVDYNGRYTLYKVNSGAFISTGLNLPAIHAWTEDSKYIYTSDTIYEFDRANNKLISVGSIHVSGITDISIGNEFVVFKHTSTPYISLYRTNNNTLVYYPTDLSFTSNSVVILGDNALISLELSSSNQTILFNKIIPLEDVLFNFIQQNVIPLSIDSSTIVSCWSGNDKYWAICHSISPYLSIYNFEDGTIKHNRNIILSSTPVDMAWSPNNKYLIISLSTYPYIIIYKYEEDMFVELSNPSILLENGRKIVWSSNSKYVALNTNDVAIYEISNDIFTKINSPSVLPSGVVNDLVWSPDDKYIAVGHNAVPFMSIYELNRNILTKLDNPEYFPGGNVTCIIWSPDGKYIMASHDEAPYITIYQFENEKLIHLGNLEYPLLYAPKEMKWSPDGKYVGMIYNESPYFILYNIIDNKFSRIDNPSVLPSSSANDIAWSSDGQFIAITHDNVPYVTFYSTILENTIYPLDSLEEAINKSKMPTFSGISFAESDTRAGRIIPLYVLFK